MKTNIKPSDYRIDQENRLAGGCGVYVAKQQPEQYLRRLVLANLLWEDIAYIDGVSVAEQIKNLISRVDKDIVFNLIKECRFKQKLRHVPLFLICECAKHTSHHQGLANVISEVIQRADELTELLALYWKEGRKPVAKQIKLGLALAFTKFNAYQLAKYNRNSVVKLRDVLRLTHPRPCDESQALLWKQVIDDTLPTPDIWEVALSTGKDKKETFTRLIQEHKLGALAFLRNLRNMIEAKVADQVILYGFNTIKTNYILPTNGFIAAKYAPSFSDEIEKLLINGMQDKKRLPGKTILIVDCSGSMRRALSSKSELQRIDVAATLAFMVRELCERAVIYVTAGNDADRTHATKQLPNLRGFALAEKIKSRDKEIGGGGIFTKQCLEYVKGIEKEADRVIVISDSQDCDSDIAVPKPFGRYNYIMDVSCNKYGVSYAGVWTAEISGWSENVIDYINMSEK